MYSRVLLPLRALATLGHLSQGERQDVFPGTSPLRALAGLVHLSQGERQDVFPGTSPLRALAALGHLSQGERQGMLARYTERCIEVRFYQFGKLEFTARYGNI